MEYPEKQPTLTQMYATHEDSNRKGTEDGHDNTNCKLWNASKKYDVINYKDIPEEIQEVMNQQDMSMAMDSTMVEVKEEDTIETQDESGMDHLIALLDESTDD